MIKLKSLLKEEREPIDSDQWDDWYEYLDYFSGDVGKDEILKIIRKHRLTGKTYFNKQIVELTDKKQKVYLEYDNDTDTASLIKDIDQWVYDVDYSTLGIDPDTMYNGHVESTLKDLKQSPGKVYHYTTEDGWELIQQDGKMVGSYGTGINNRGAYGIFTSVDPEEYANGTYGNICLELDLQRFKEDTNLQELNLEFEPEVEEQLIREYIRYTLGIENDDYVSSDISSYTVIVNHVIPLDYIKEL